MLKAGDVTRDVRDVICEADDVPDDVDDVIHEAHDVIRNVCDVLDDVEDVLYDVPDIKNFMPDIKNRQKCQENGENHSILGKFGPFALQPRTDPLPDGQFEPLTRQMVQTIVQNARGAKLIWASTTPVRSQEHPDQLDPEINGNILQQNAGAAKVMAENKIPIRLRTKKVRRGTSEIPF